MSWRITCCRRRPNGRFAPWSAGVDMPRHLPTTITRGRSAWRTLRGAFRQENGARRRLLHPHVLGEIVVLAAVAGELPAHHAIPFAAEHLGEEALLRGPTGFGLGLAVAARHGVVEPAVRRAAIDVDVVA